MRQSSIERVLTDRQTQHASAARTLDLGEEDLPAGTQLAIGEAVIEITASPHQCCKRFAGRYGRDALRFVNSAVGYAMKLRGVAARVVSGGMARRTPRSRLSTGP